MDNAAPAERRLARESALVGAATVASRLLGFARDVLIARLLGTGPVADAFLAALRLPNLVRRLFSEGGLNAPFVPLYIAVKHEGGAQDASRFAGQALSFLALVLLALVGLGLVFAPWLVLGFAAGFHDDPATLSLAAGFTRLMLPFVLLTTLASMLAALLNAEGRFALAALAPALMNAILVGFLVATLWIDAPQLIAAKWLAVLVSVTGLAHLALVGIGLARSGLPRPSLRWSSPMRQLVTTGGATLLAASIGQLVLLVSTQIASAEPGAVAALYYADRLFQLPLGFVGVGMGTVVLSQMSAGDGAAQDAMLGRALVLGLALAVPAAVALIALAEPIVSALFEHGRFGAQDRVSTSAALAAFAVGLPFAVTAKVFGQLFFARRRPRPALMAGFVALAAAALCGIASVAPGQTAALGAFAASVAFVTQAGLLAVMLWRHGLWRPRPAIFRPLAAIAAASLVMLGCLLLLLPRFGAAIAPDQPVSIRLATLALLCLAGLSAYAGAAWLFGLRRHLR